MFGQLPNVRLELIGEVNIYVAMALQIIAASLLGGLIGLDREKKLKPAGVKTNMLICVGATLYTSISLAQQKALGGVADPNRVAAQIVSGIGFLGAGAIMRGGAQVLGLTTAATIWVVAAIGVAIGSGYPIIAGLFTMTILSILNILNPLYDFFVGTTNYRLEILTRGTILKKIRAVLDHAHIQVEHVESKVIDENKNLQIVEIEIHTNPKRIKAVHGELKKVMQIESVSFLQIDVEYPED